MSHSCVYEVEATTELIAKKIARGRARATWAFFTRMASSLYRDSMKPVDEKI